jgi:PPOX class probable F420-dependent enzyme
MPEMTSAETAAFLDRARVADLVTLRRDGAPHVAPVWCQWAGGRVLVMAEASSVKARNIRRDPRVAISVATQSEPYEYVVVEGTAEVWTEGVEGPVLEISVRYRGSERGGRFARELLADHEMVVIAVTPRRMITHRDET